MDIVVTIPKIEYQNDDVETMQMQSDDGLVQFWTLPVIPKMLNVGDRIYFIKNQQVESSMKVINIVLDSKTTCETTGRVWSGKCQLFIDDLRKENYPFKVRGFQGLRYFQTVLNSVSLD